ncbi:MAG TPA: BBP7 family outer membrane beta-barrel protein, partial [Pirellula sp.]|nr:BBP7 family outer membrane beta-barrel protein [Pirellula sp.]
MVYKNIREFRRRAYRTALNMGLGLSVFAFTNLVDADPAFAQLRSGRSTDREFYAQDEPTVPAPQRSAGKRTNTSVISASATEAVSAEDAVTRVRQVKMRPAAASHASGEKVTSRVVHAGCKNCQAGIAHSHTPEANRPSQAIVDNQDFSEPSGLGEDIHDPDAMVFGSTCQPCVTGCESVGMCQSPNIVGSLLRRLQFRIEAATFWPDGQNLPQLVTTRRPANDPATDGLIGRTDTTNLFGGTEVLGESTHGIRGELGTYFNDCKSYGILLRFYDVGSNTLSYNSTPTSEPVVMRPFFSTDNNAQSTLAVNYPNSTSGSLNANISSDMYGGDILFRRLILRDCAGRLEFLAGYQTARLADSLAINSTTTALTNTPAPAGTISQL